MNPNSRKIWLGRLLVLGTLLASLGSCSSFNRTLSDNIVSNSQNKLEEKKGPIPLEDYFEFNNLIADSIGVFKVVTRQKIPDKVTKALQQKVKKALENSNLYKQVLNSDDITSQLEKNPKLNQEKEIYLDSLVIVSVSDRDIANPLGKYLGIKNIFIMQVDLWPCKDCETKDIIRLKARLVDTKTGYIIWTGINEQDTVSIKDDKPEQIIGDMTDELLNKFYHRFKKKWHKIRFHQLANNGSS